MDSSLAEKDPIMKLGYGLTAYRNLMFAMMVVFCGFVMLQLPAFIIYGNGDGYASMNPLLVGRQQYSLGALGYASTQCSQIPMGIHKL